jgi:hypothetical protein
VAPVVLATELLEVLLEESTHGDDTVSHTLDLTQPLLVEFGVVQDGRSDTGTVDGRVGVKRADQDLDLRVDTLLLVGIGANNGEGTNTLTVETLASLAYAHHCTGIAEDLPCSWRNSGRVICCDPP